MYIYIYSHTHTPTENNTSDTDTHTRQEQHPKPHTHDKNNTPNPQTNTPHKHLTRRRQGCMAAWRLQDIVVLRGVCARTNHLFMAPPHSHYLTIALLLRDHCAMRRPSPTPPVYAIHHTILVMAISFKGQASPTRFLCARGCALLFGLYTILSLPILYSV